MATSGENLDDRQGHGASGAAEAYKDGFSSFPVSLPFPAFGTMSAYQRAFYEGWITAAYALFGDAGPMNPEVRLGS